MNFQTKNLLREYTKRSSFITVETIDPEKKPTIANQYGVTSFGTFIVESGEKKERIEAQDIVDQGMEGDSYSYKGEQRFTQAILNIVNENKTKLYFTTGHEELPAEQMSQFQSDLEKEGYEVVETNLLRSGKVPDDADILLIVGALQDISEAEKKLIQTYIDGKGKVLFCLSLSESMNETKQYDALLGNFGIVNQKVLALESQKSAMSDPGVVVPFYEAHPITEKLQQSKSTAVLLGATSLSAKEKQGKWTNTPLLKTSDDSFGLKNLDTLKQGGIDITTLPRSEGDVAGPLQLAYAVADDKGKSKAVVVANSNFLIDQYYAYFPGNRDFVLNSIGWLAENKNAVTIRPVNEKIQSVVISPSAGNFIFYGTVIGMPLLLLLIGGFIWLRRRRA